MAHPTFDAFVALCFVHGVPAPTCEYRFSVERRWRFDYTWLSQKVAVEVEGGAFTRGRHTRGPGFLADMEKYNRAALEGWKVLRYTPQQLTTQSALAEIRQALGLPLTGWRPQEHP